MATTQGNVLSYNGNLYLNSTPNYSSAMMSIPGPNYRIQSGIDYGIKNGWLTPIGGQLGQRPAAAPTQRPAFTPNAFTQSQLAGMGGGAAPQWMMDAYTQKIGSMGGNANLPPFGVTQSGFPGTGGKAAPSVSRAGGRSGGTPMARQG